MAETHTRFGLGIKGTWNLKTDKVKHIQAKFQDKPVLQDHFIFIKTPKKQPDINLEILALQIIMRVKITGTYILFK